MLESSMGSDPIYSSAGKPVNKHREEANRNIIQYPDPLEQGLDSDIRHSIANEKMVSKELGHTWTVNKN